MPNSKSPMMSINLPDMHASIGYNGKLEQTHKRLLPKMALKYDFNSNSNLYVSAAMGQRSGGYNLQMFSDMLQGAMRVEMMQGVKQGVGDYMDELSQKYPQIPATVATMVKGIMEENIPALEAPTTDQVVYKPEYSINYEIGTHLTFPNSHLLLDASLFWSEIRNQQIARFAPTGLGRMMVNAGESRSKGGEISISWQPIEALSFSTNYGFTDARFVKYDDGSDVDYSDNKTPFVPMHTLNFDMMYSWKFNNTWVEKLSAAVCGNGAGRVYWDETNSTWQDFYLLPGARISVENKNMTLTVWGKNLSDTHYNTFAFTSVGLNYEQHGKPRQFGVDLKIRF